MTQNVAELLASLTPDQRKGLSWGDRGGGQYWHARWGDRSTIGNGGPYASASEAVRAVLGMEVSRTMSDSKPTLPVWADCAAKHERRAKLTALEYFVLENEPRGFAGDYWRKDLIAALKEEIDAR